MKILITGGAGFIGSNFIYFERANHPQDKLVCVDKLTYAGDLETLEPVLPDKNFRFVRADIADRAAMDALFAEERAFFRSIRNINFFALTAVLYGSVFPSGE